MKLTQAVCKFAAKSYSTRHVQRLNAVFTLADGEETTVWASPGYEPLTATRRGDRVQLAQDHKGNYRLIEPEATGSAPTNGKPSRDGDGFAPQGPESTEGWTTQEKQAIARHVQQHADLLAYCYRTAAERFSDLSEESVRCLATTIFIQTMR